MGNNKKFTGSKGIPEIDKCKNKSKTKAIEVAKNQPKQEQVNGEVCCNSKTCAGSVAKDSKIIPKISIKAKKKIIKNTYLNDTNANGVNNQHKNSNGKVKDRHKPGYINKGKRSKLKLGVNVSSEQNTEVGGGTVVKPVAKECSAVEGNGNVKDLPINGSKTPLAAKLRDSKSNRMLQRINPEQSYKNSKLRSIVTEASSVSTINHGSPRSRDLENSRKKGQNNTVVNKVSNNVKKAPTKVNKVSSLKPSTVNAKLSSTETNGYVRRSRANEFPGVMELLDNTEHSEENNKKSPIKRNESVAKSLISDSGHSENYTPKESPNKNETVICNSADYREKIPTKSPTKSPSKENKVSKESPQSHYVPTASVNGRLKFEREKNMVVSPRYNLVPCKNHSGKHQDEVLEAVLFCAICRESVCYKCAFERHKEHDVSPIPTAADTIRIKLAENKRKIEANISHLRARRKASEANSDDVAKRMQVQFSAVMDRIREKEQEVIAALENVRQQSLNAVYKLQTQQETTWNQIDAVLKTQEDAKMLQEYTMLDPIATNLEFSPCTSTDSGCMSPSSLSPRAVLDLHNLQSEIEKISLQCEDDNAKISEGNKRPSGVGGLGDNEMYRKQQKKYLFKLDQLSANPALRLTSNGCCVEFIGSERNSLVRKSLNNNFSGAANKAPRLSPNHPLLQGASMSKWRKTQFATVLSDSPITQGRQYWEVSVNRSMEYKLGVAYKHIQGTKTLPDDHNSWMLSLSYPDRFSALHKGRKEYIFISGQASMRNIKVIRIGVFVDFERGILSFYNATNTAERRHLYTFRTFFNRPVWPILSLRQGKLQIITGIPVPRNLVWKTR